MAAVSAAHAQQAPRGLGDLHDALHLAPAQEAAFRAYAAAVTPSREALARQQATEQMLPQLPTPRRLALIQAAMEKDADDFKREGAAVNAFYAQLSPDQQRIFDRETLPSASPPGGPPQVDDDGGANRLKLPPPPRAD
jgi:hypothetical protein